jgi:AcrR family transcriptional regulator
MATIGSAKRGQRGQRRCQDILDAANAVFLERGYSGASIDAIVERAGSSKETVYAHFENKAGLLKAIVERGTEVFRKRLEVIDDDSAVETVLLGVAQDFIRFLLHPDTLAFYRLVIAESGRMPEVGDIFFRMGPETTARRLAERLRIWTAQGHLCSLDPDRDATLFFAMLRGDLQWRALLNPTRAPIAAEREEHVRFVVASFLSLCRMPARLAT